MARKEALLRLRQMLVKRRDALRKALAGDLSVLKELSEQNTGDVADFALSVSSDEISSQLAEAESRELGQIDVALERMAEGSYGRCEQCNGVIGMARLSALPYAVTCIECQRDSEHDHRGGARSAADYGRIMESDVEESNVSINDIELDVT
ncbi:MAG TPA: TraR/DksA family transcriptional regulator [Pirellulales bacterium]